MKEFVGVLLYHNEANLQDWLENKIKGCARYDSKANIYTSYTKHIFTRNKETPQCREVWYAIKYTNTDYVIQECMGMQLHNIRFLDGSFDAECIMFMLTRVRGIEPFEVEDED